MEVKGPEEEATALVVVATAEVVEDMAEAVEVLAEEAAVTGSVEEDLVAGSVVGERA